MMNDMNNNEQNRLRDHAFTAMGCYLHKCGWTESSTSAEPAVVFYWIDPITGFPHRTDFAFIIQTERDMYNLFHPSK